VTSVENYVLTLIKLMMYSALIEHIRRYERIFQTK